MSRTLTVPQPISVIPSLWVRPRQGPAFSELVREPNTTRADGDSDSFDALGTAYAASDGDLRTSWTGPQGVVVYRTAPSLTMTLPEPTEVTGLRITPSASNLPTHPTLVAVDLGDGPQVRTTEPEGTQTLSLHPRVTKTITISVLEWTDVIDRTALGFDQVKPPGLAEVVVLGANGRPIAPADAARNRARPITIGCDKGPVIAVAGRFVHTEVRTTVGALFDGDPLLAKPCDAGPIDLPAGQQELLVSPGAAFIVDGVQLSGPLAADAPVAHADPTQTGEWTADHREVTLPPQTGKPADRVLVVPESINPGWTAHAADGSTLHPVTVNGWQQGWVVPADTSGTVTMTFGSNTLYRAGLAGGLMLLPVLALLALVAPRRPTRAGSVQPWAPGPWAVLGALAVGAVIAGPTGVVVFGLAAGLLYLLRDRPRADKLVTVGGTAVALILAGAALSRYPWRSVHGYSGHSPWVQLLALTSVGLLTASVLVWSRDRRSD